MSIRVYLGVALEDVDPPRAAKEFSRAEVLSGLDPDAFQDLVVDMRGIVGELQAPPADGESRGGVRGGDSRRCSRRTLRRLSSDQTALYLPVREKCM
jgi:hypothetical protein